MKEYFFESPQEIVIDDTMPLIFLEGPVQGAPDWQGAFAKRLLENVPGIAVASPRAIPEQQAAFASADPEVRDHASDLQVAYEFIARRRAFQFGAIAIWWAAQDPSLDYNSERVYAKTTAKEESEVWGMLFSNPDFPFIVGYDPGFVAGPRNSRSYSERNHGFLDIDMYESLEEVYEATERTAKQLVTSGDPRPVPALTALSIRRALDQLRSK